MPRFDGTGPFSAGPMTGRGMGNCGAGVGLRGRCGFRRGMGFDRWNLLQTAKDQKESLADYRKALETELEYVKREEEELNEG